MERSCFPRRSFISAKDDLTLNSWSAGTPCFVTRFHAGDPESCGHLQWNYSVEGSATFDGKGKTLLPNGVVIVQEGKILDAGSALAIPDGANVIELGDATLSPGFIDSHTHLTSDYSRPYNQRRLEDLETEVPLAAYEAIPLAERTLAAGFTTVRDLGSESFLDVALRDAIAKGIVRGPAMIVATKGIGATGGHFDDTNGFRDLLFWPRP